jgi:hypothetical protein
MQLFPHEIAIGILGDEFEDGAFPGPRDAFDGREDALDFLRELTEEDLGEDVARWRAWFGACSREMLDLHYDEWRRKRLIRDRPSRVAYAEGRWRGVTRRRCPNCGGLCPEYRASCWVCEHSVGRAPA